MYKMYIVHFFDSCINSNRVYRNAHRKSKTKKKPTLEPNTDVYHAHGATSIAGLLVYISLWTFHSLSIASLPSLLLLFFSFVRSCLSVHLFHCFHSASTPNISSFIVVALSSLFSSSLLFSIDWCVHFYSLPHQPRYNSIRRQGNNKTPQPANSQPGTGQ